MTHAQEQDAPPPFDPAAARAARNVMALTPERVAATLASYGVNAFPRDVRAWEDGTLAPSEAELVGLASALAVPVERLMGDAPTSLMSRRLRAGMSRADIGRKVGMSEATWTRLERTNTWRADERRTEALVKVLGGLSHRELVEVSGGGPELSGHLARCLADGRRTAHLGPITELLGARRRKVGEALEALAAEFPPDTVKPAEGAEGADPELPDGALDRFWSHLGNPPADPFAPAVWRRPPSRG
ncbi:helix-turn-helix domain-containing protein [Yinghuangia soli]|uniref:Helix-turn-helix domain-containing protein n=1 Tax=Yinghuangia soli TaxID=2908204 RepID=A0AA41Q2P8_9ACTN|nr:helix-turn-helix transcriptional regulator [Yinghuangia soli]MCF2530216.1 helix-turn-helix domain-containing protein [Yinghuangia soli]